VTVVLGALTANVPGAAIACRGFPWCRAGIAVHGAPLHVQLVHRTLAVLLLLHLGATSAASMRRRESGVIVRAGHVALGVIVLQLVVAAALVELRLPPALQSMHQVVGTLLWVAVFSYAALARRAVVPQTDRVGESLPRGVVA